jgi:CheY-like chemotaxis protein
MSEVQDFGDSILEGKTLLVVDDENDLREIVASELEFMGAKVFQAENISSAKQILTDTNIDLVVSDIRMPGGTGIDLLDFIKARNPDKVPVVLITGFADITPEDAYHKGAEALLNKPFKLDDLVNVVALHTTHKDGRLGQEPDRPQQALELDFSQSLDQCQKEGTVFLGRGGISFLYDSNQKVDCTQNLTFKLNFQGQVLEGIANCRSIKSHGENTRKLAITLEFLFLEEKSRDVFLSRIRPETLVPYLPALK